MIMTVYLFILKILIDPFCMPESILDTGNITKIKTHKRWNNANYSNVLASLRAHGMNGALLTAFVCYIIQSLQNNSVSKSPNMTN